MREFPPATAAATFLALTLMLAGAGDPTANAATTVTEALQAPPPAHAPAPRGGPYTPSPIDWRDESIYQIVTDRFFNGDPSNDGVEGSFDPSDGAQNHGGDWAGIEAKLDYIQGLGATALWISPVQTNAYAYYHGYGIRDFYGFAEHFGGLDDLRSVIDEGARPRHVRHPGRHHEPRRRPHRFRDAGVSVVPEPIALHAALAQQRLPADAPFNDLSKFHHHGHIGDYSDPEQILGELFGLDDFRTEDPTVRSELIAAHQWLVEQTDADGFRIDTVKHVELDFWQEFGPAMRSYATGTLGKSDFLMFGEVFDGSPVKNGIYTGTVAGGAFALDSVLWYPMYFTARSVFRDGAPTEWLSFTLADSVHYEPGSTPRNVTFLDNHDNGRFMGFGSSAQGDDAKLRSALTWAHTSMGIPLVYYGTEQEFDGGGDPYNREDMWDGLWDFGPSEGDNFDPTRAALPARPPSQRAAGPRSRRCAAEPRRTWPRRAATGSTRSAAS